MTPVYNKWALLLAFYSLANFNLTQAANLPNCGKKDLFFGAWSRDAWANIAPTMYDLCNSLGTADKHSTKTVTKTGWAVTMQYKLQPGMTSAHCYQAMNDIVSNCFDSQNHGGYSSIAASWQTDPNQKEWYWMWMNREYFEHPYGPPGERRTNVTEVEERSEDPQ